jgi:head-tail adaptor
VREITMDYQVNAGDLRTSITFQSPTISTDAGAAQKPTWANVSTNPTVLSRWVNAHGQENAGNAKASVQRALVTIRQRIDVQTTWRIVKGTENWEIISIDAVQGKNRYVELVVERVKGTV